MSQVRSQIPDADREAITNEVRNLGAKSVLEFGPGDSTEIFISLGLDVTTCEYDDTWLAKAIERFPGVDVRRYFNISPEARIEGELDVFDLAFVDSPAGDRRRVKLEGQEFCSRLNTMLCALRHAPIVLLHDCYRPFEQEAINRLVGAGHKLSYLSEGLRSIAGKGIAKIERCD